MKDTDNTGAGAQRSAVILGRDEFTRRSRQVEARAQARRYFEFMRRAAIRRQLVHRLLNRDRQAPDLHSRD